MIYHREHPGSRKTILAFLKKFNDCSLDELLDRKDIYLSKFQKSQAHKMIEEGQFRTGLQIYQEQKKEKIMRSVGMIR